MLRKYTKYKDTQASQSDNQILTRILEIVIDIDIQIKIDIDIQINIKIQIIAIKTLR